MRGRSNGVGVQAEEGHGEAAAEAEAAADGDRNEHGAGKEGCLGYPRPRRFTRTFSRRGKTPPVKLQMVNWWIASGAILCVLISPMVVQAGSQKGDKPMTVSSGTQVSIEYTLRLEDEAVVDTNVGSDPLTYVHGSQQIIPGLEKGLNGMKIGVIYDWA
jgi:hypothetical protein